MERIKEQQYVQTAVVQVAIDQIYGILKQPGRCFKCGVQAVLCTGRCRGICGMLFND